SGRAIGPASRRFWTCSPPRRRWFRQTSRSSARASPIKSPVHRSRRCWDGTCEARAMMWIVRVALRRPYTFVSGAILVLIAGLVAIVTTPVDIFPAIPLPVVTVIWQYNGMSPEEMEERVVTIVERSYSVTVNDIEHIESQSFTGVAVIKIYFQPDADVATG